jgi:hypothetical protein
MGPIACTSAVSRHRMALKQIVRRQERQPKTPGQRARKSRILYAILSIISYNVNFSLP